jgi:CheY-like chemotaxis protein
MAAETSEKPEHAARVLVIDDDTLVRRTMCAALKKLGYITTEAATGREGVAEYKKARHDIVITDVMMPDKNGLQTIRIVAMSGGGTNTDGSYLELARDVGALATLAKPFTPDDIAQVLAQLDAG